jgi:hypothetical protein
MDLGNVFRLLISATIFGVTYPLISDIIDYGASSFTNAYLPFIIAAVPAALAYLVLKNIWGNPDMDYSGGGFRL